MQELPLPPPMASAVRPIFERWPLESVMSALVVTAPASAELSRAVEAAVGDPVIAGRPALAAGLWLYADELDRSHRISQGLDDATGAFWHGIMHRREGDFANSHYWFRRVGPHPALERLGPEYDAHGLIDRVEAATRRREAPADLVALQRHEWAALFAWCGESSA